jgi:hypothetical protein
VALPGCQYSYRETFLGNVKVFLESHGVLYQERDREQCEWWERIHRALHAPETTFILLKYDQCGSRHMDGQIYI